MLRSLLIGLENSASCIAAQELGIRWARRYGADLVGLAIVDDPGIGFAPEAVPSRGQGTPQVQAAQTHVEASLRRTIHEFATRCGDAGVAFRTIEEVGSPHLQILLEAQRHDLIVLGQRSRFEYGYEGDPGQTLEKALQDTPRPLIAVPEALGDGEAAVIAYDGSLQASRALAAFEATGLGHDRAVHILCADSDREDAARQLDRASEFLRAHGIEATPHVLNLSAALAETILDQLRQLNAGLLVMGAYGQPILREFFVGSVTRTMLEKCPVPIFLFH